MKVTKMTETRLLHINVLAPYQHLQLLVIVNCELDVLWSDATLLVISCMVAGKLQDLGGQVLEHSRKIAGCVFANPCPATRLGSFEVTFDSSTGKQQPMPL
mmetsp:Transcript_24894/g.49550  ORF Transcript_24894/g.49550 Transcript_24894/m.49550 type:complete len:101 (-) Transcript_24894:234-536(-)